MKQRDTTKTIAIMGALAVPLAAGAGTGVAGTRLGGDYTPLTNASSTGVGFGALAQMLLALAIVAFLLKWALPKLAGKVAGKKVSTSGGIQVEESAQFAGGSLFIISARGRSLLVGATGQSVTMLADLTEAPKPDPFEIALAEAKMRPVPTAQELEAQASLDRLSRLVGSHG